jgi:hypothetical protein
MKLIEIRARQFRPARLKLDADGSAAEVARLDQGRADSAHGIDNEVAALAVCLDHTSRERRQHLAGVSIGLWDVALVSLPLARALCARPDRY